MRIHSAFVPAAILSAWACAPLSDGAPTFAHDVAPIVHRRCTPCHRPGEAAPFPLITYEHVRRRGRQIGIVVESGYMPPWLPDAEVAAFRGDRSLDEDERTTLLRWIAAEMPRGPAAAIPPAPQWTEGWQLGEPDLVLTMPRAFTVPAEGRDVYRNFVIPAVPGGQRWVRAVEWQPDNRTLLHHAVLFVDRSGATRAMDAADPVPGFGGMSARPAQVPGGQFIGWTPGNVPDPGEEGIAWLLDDVTDVVLQLHLRPSGRTEDIRVSIGLHFADQPPSRHPVSLRLMSRAIDIPPGVDDYVVEDDYELPVDVALQAIYPHAHYLADDMRAWARLPDGTRRELFHIPSWDFNWQDEYFYAEPIDLPRGTVVSMRYTYDNTAENPLNPNDPPRRVVFGEQSSDEMGELMLQVIPAEEDLPFLWRDFAHKVLADDTEDFRARAEAQPEVAGWQRQLHDFALRSGRPADAVRHARRWVALRPGNKVLPVASLGHALVEAGSYMEALEPLRSVLERRPDHPEARVDLGRALVGLGRHAEALAELERAVATESAIPAAHAALGDAFLAAGQGERAIEAYRRTLSLAPDDVDVMCRLGELYLAEERLDETVRLLRKAERLFRHRFLDADLDRERSENRAHYLLGLALERRGEREEARRFFETALRLEPGNATFAAALEE